MTDPIRIGAVMPPRIADRIAAGHITVDPTPFLRETTEEARARAKAAEGFRTAKWDTRRPRRYATAALTDLTPQQDPRGAVSRWWASDSLTLVLFSPQPGLGKTHALYAVGNHATAHGAWCEGWTTIELLAALRPPHTDPDVMDRALSCDLLALDDVGREADSDWTREQVQRIVSHRVSAGLRQVITTNLDGVGMNARLSAPLVDRLVDEATIVEFKGTSYRKPAAW